MLDLSVRVGHSPPGAQAACARHQGGPVAANVRILIAEVLGTCVLMLGGPGSAILAGGDIGTLGIAIAFGFSLSTWPTPSAHLRMPHQPRGDGGHVPGPAHRVQQAPVYFAARSSALRWAG